MFFNSGFLKGLSRFTAPADDRRPDHGESNRSRRYDDGDISDRALSEWITGGDGANDER
jgi:hypothetical protein